MAADVEIKQDLQRQALKKLAMQRLESLQSGAQEQVYREETGEVLTAPSGLSGGAVSYLDDTQNKKQPKENFFGFTNIGNPIDATRGYLKGIIQSGAELSLSDLESKEKQLAELNIARRDFKITDVLAQFLPTAKGKAAEIRTSQAIDLPFFRGEKTFEQEAQKIQSRINDIKKIRKDLPKVIDAMGLESNYKSLAGQLGQGSSSLAFQMGSRIITGNPVLGAAAMYKQTKTSAYNEAREAGLPISQAANASFVEAVGIGLIEAIGTEALFKTFGGSSILKSAVKGYLVQGTEEGAQEIWSILTKNDFNVTDTKSLDAVSQVLNSFMIGGLLGAPVSGGMTAVQKSEVEQRVANDLGINKKDARRLISIAEQSMPKSEVLQEASSKAASEAIDNEFSPVKGEYSVNPKLERLSEQFLNGEDLDISILSDQEKNQLFSLIPEAERDLISAIGENQIIAIEQEQQNQIILEAQDIKQQLDAIQDVDFNKPTELKKVLGYTPESLSQFIKKIGGIVDKYGKLAARDINTKTGVGVIRRGSGVDADQLSFDGRKSSVPDNENIDFIRERVFDAGYFPDKTDYNEISDTELFDAIASDLTGDKVYTGDDLVAIENELSGSRQASEDIFRRGIERSMSIDQIVKVLREERGLGEFIPSDPIEIVTPVPLAEVDAVTPEVIEAVKIVDKDNRGLISGSLIPAPLKEFGGAVGEGLERAITPISTRIRNINEALAFRLRRFEFDVRKQQIADNEAVSGFLRVYAKLDTDTQYALDLALKNGDMEVIEQIALQNNISEQIDIVRKVLDGIFSRAQSVNMDINYRFDFFPRKVKDVNGLLDYLYGQDYWSIIQEAIEKREEKTGKPSNKEDRIQIINTLMRGFEIEGISLAKRGVFKERSIKKVTAEINKFYETSEQALLGYINVANDAIETSRLFGRAQDIDTANNIDNSIGGFINDMLARKEITSSQADTLKEILSARFNPRKMGWVVGSLRDLTYIDVMGSPLNAITQFGDLTTSMYNSGIISGVGTLPSAMTDRTEINLKDLGIEDKIAQEFDNNSLTSSGVSKVFRATGLNKIDRIGKLNLVNSALKKFRNQAKKSNPELTEQLDLMFAEEAGQVLSDLQNGVNSENVKFLVFNTLLDFQPVARSEMPEYYLTSGNLKILYILKSFTLKQLDVYRREVISNLHKAAKTGDVKLATKAMTNFIRLAGFWIAMGASADYMKDLLRSAFGGDEVEEPEDYVIDNIFKAFGWSRYQSDMIGKEGISTVFFDLFKPPTKFLDNVETDYKEYKKGKLTLENSRSIRSIPVGGELYYYWFGGNSGQKTENNSSKKTNPFD